MTLRRSLYARPEIIGGEQCTTGAFARANGGEEGAVGVVADIAKLSIGREEYYTRELASDHHQCLSGHGESPGRWYGAGASSLGLKGEASVAGFQAMFEGRDPRTGELLGRPHGRNAVPAFDVVLRPTKSVSIIYGLGDPATGRAVLAAHHVGLAEAVAYLDEHLGARRGHGGHEHVSGQGLLAVGFDHRTSREGDPLLHTHLVVANRVQGPDGRWTALDGRDLYRHRLAADAIYRATYQRELVRTLGVEWTPADSHGNRELQGVPEDLVRSFSKRAGQIEAELDRLAADGWERTPRLVKWTVQATRKHKQHQTPDTLYSRWRQEAAERGVDPDTLVRTVTSRTANRVQDRTVSGEAVDRLFDRLAGPNGLTATASTFTRPDAWSLSALGWPGPDGPCWRSWRIGSWPSGRSAWSPTEPWRSAAGPPPAFLGSSSGWSRPRLVGRANGPPWLPIRRCARPWPPIAPPAPTSRPWSATCARAAKGSPWWWGGPGRARPSS
jgi:conjugative relaxase-like TrwC/TraI family protein